ncbi:Early endosome antigen 1 [Taenia solium]
MCATSFVLIPSLLATKYICLWPDMSEITEGYLCPECLLNLNSEAALISHFKKNHGSAPKDSEVEELVEGYGDLILDRPADETVSRLSLLEDIILSLLKGTLTPHSIPEIDLKPKIQAFLQEQVNRKTGNDALILQLTTERDSALSEVSQLKDRSAQLQSQLQATCHELSAKEKELAEVKNKLEDSSRKLGAIQNERHTFVQPQQQSPNRQIKERLEGDLGKIEPKTPDASKQLIVELRKEIDSLKANLDDSTKTLKYLKAENKALVEKTATLSLEAQVKEEQIAEFEKTVKAVRDNEKTQRVSLDEAKEAAKQKDAMIESLQQAMHQLMSDMEAKSEECERLAKQISDLTSESNLLNKKIAKLNVELNELRTQLTCSVDSENALKQRVVEMDIALASQNEELGNRASIVIELESKLTSTFAEQQALMDQLIESQNRSKQLETALQTSHQELEGLQRIVLDLGRQNQALQITQDRLTNRQWVSDESAQSCSNCQKEFSISVRKHHCRHCGKVFCQACSSKKTATSASKDPLRVCDACFAELTGAW